MQRTIIYTVTMLTQFFHSHNTLLYNSHMAKVRGSVISPFTALAATTAGLVK
jgi:hypothetical protein